MDPLKKRPPPTKKKDNNFKTSFLKKAKKELFT